MFNLSFGLKRHVKFEYLPFETKYWNNVVKCDGIDKIQMFF